MKNLLTVIICISLLFNSGCATLFGGKLDDCQTIKPAPGQPTRQIRGWALAGDIGLPLIAAAITGGVALGAIVWTGIDFATNHIYKPCKYKKVRVDDPPK